MTLQETSNTSLKQSDDFHTRITTQEQQQQQILIKISDLYVDQETYHPTITSLRSRIDDMTHMISQHTRELSLYEYELKQIQMRMINILKLWNEQYRSGSGGAGEQWIPHVTHELQQVQQQLDARIAQVSTSTAHTSPSRTSHSSPSPSPSPSSSSRFRSRPRSRVRVWHEPQAPSDPRENDFLRSVLG
jgi:chromosome segregation ATPase